MQTLDRSGAPPNMRLFTDPRQPSVSGMSRVEPGVTAHVPGEPLRWEGFEDSAVASAQAVPISATCAS